jgi:hypothetical protein
MGRYARLSDNGSVIARDYGSRMASSRWGGLRGRNLELAGQLTHHAEAGAF